MAKTLETTVQYDANTVTLDQLITVPRIGKDLALVLLDRRKECGGFKSIDQIRKLNIKGLGGKKVESLIQHLSFSEKSEQTTSEPAEKKAEKVEKVSETKSSDPDLDELLASV